MGYLIKRFERKLTEIKNECSEMLEANNVKMYQLYNSDKDM